MNESAGTAIIFKGNVTHSGLPVTSGIRHLFVMSFSLSPKAKKVPNAADLEDDYSGTDDGMPMVDSDGGGYDSDLGF